MGWRSRSRVLLAGPASNPAASDLPVAVVVAVFVAVIAMVVVAARFEVWAGGLLAQVPAQAR